MLKEIIFEAKIIFSLKCLTVFEIKEKKKRKVSQKLQNIEIQKGDHSEFMKKTAKSGHSQ